MSCDPRLCAEFCHTVCHNGRVWQSGGPVLTVNAPTLDELRARVTEKGPWFTVPAETRPTQCTGCAAVIYFITTDAGKKMPVDVLVPGGQMPRRGPSEIRDGRGVSHFATCPASAAFRKPRP